MTKATASKDHLTTISSLKPYASKMTLGGPPECPTFAGCEPGSRRSTASHFAGFKSLDEAGRSAWPRSRTARSRWWSCSRVTATWCRNNFVALTDNKHLEGADYIVPVIRKSVDTPAWPRPWPLEQS